MNEYFNGLIRQSFSPSVNDPIAEHAFMLNQGIKMFQNTLARGRWARLVSILFNKQCLIDVNSTNLKIRSSHYIGVRCVPINQICGSESKASDFDRSFRPLCERSRDRWVSIFLARSQNISMPAVELVQIEDCYFIRDGHHRISVAKTLGQDDIDAEVTVWQVSGELPWQTSHEPSLVALWKLFTTLLS